MSNVIIGPPGTGSLPTASTIDSVADIIPIYTSSATATQGINRNTLLGLASQPVGITDTQTLTNKTLTSPTISGPTLSGTITGTYTIGGTPTFPSNVVTLTGTQTLTNKTLTSPTINSPSITNATITSDNYVGYTSTNTGSIYGITVSSTNVSMPGTLAVTGATTLSSTLAVTGLLTASGGISIPNGSTLKINSAPVWQYLGYTKVTSGNITTASTSFAVATGLTTTVTVPTGATIAKITLRTLVTGSIAGDSVTLAIYKNGSFMDQSWMTPATSGYQGPSTFIYFDTSPSSGSTTYAVYFATSNGSSTATLATGSGGSSPFTTPPAFIEVECC